MKTRTKCVLMMLLALGLYVSASAQAELVITNGDFEAGAGAGDTENVSLWYDDISPGGGFWESAWELDRAGVTPNGSMVVVFCAWNTVEGDPLTGSYVYQSIGTSSGESSVTIGFDWGHPDDVGAGRLDGITVAVYASDGTTVPGDDVDINGAAGITLLDSASYSHVAEGTDGEVFPVVVTLDLSGANEGDEIFLRFNNYLPEAGADPWPILDNVQILPDAAAPAVATIMWISDNKGFGDVEPNTPGDQGWVDLLTSLGYDVIYKNQDEYVDGEQYWRTLDPNKVAELEAVDLIVMSRNADSGSYSSVADNEPNLWNAVSTPLISFSAHMSRSNKWGWINSTGTTLGKDAKINVLDPTHPVFAGVVVDANSQVEAYSDQWNMDWVTGATDAGNGTVLATRSTDGLVSIVTWDAGEAYFDTGTAVAGGPRMLFVAGTGSKNSGDNYAPDGTYNLTADGEQIFVNAVEYMLKKSKQIVWVSFHEAADVASAGAAGAGFTEAPDRMYTDLIAAEGYSVSRYLTTSAPDPAILEAADLVIISRSVASSGYQNDGATAWNTLNVPMIITGGYVLRSSRMGFTTGTDMPDTTGDITLTVSDPTHPIFAGIALTDGTMDNPFAGVVVYPTDGTTLARGISVNNSPADDEGTVLATVSEASAATGPVGGLMIGEWPAGATLTHSGGAGTDVLGGPRLVFLTGSRETSGINSETAGLYDLYADGAVMFLNAVEYMLAK